MFAGGVMHRKLMGCQSSDDALSGTSHTIWVRERIQKSLSNWIGLLLLCHSIPIIMAYGWIAELLGSLRLLQTFPDSMDDLIHIHFRDTNFIGNFLRFE